MADDQPRERSADAFRHVQRADEIHWQLKALAHGASASLLQTGIALAVFMSSMIGAWLLQGEQESKPWLAIIGIVLLLVSIAAGIWALRGRRNKLLSMTEQHKLIVEQRRRQGGLSSDPSLESMTDLQLEQAVAREETIQKKHAEKWPARAQFAALATGIGLVTLQVFCNL